MKKTLAIAMLLALMCVLFFGCTPEPAEDETPAAAIPSLNPVSEPSSRESEPVQASEPEPDTQEQQPGTAVQTEPVTNDASEEDLPSNDTTDPEDEYYDDSEEDLEELEPVSEVIVDGGGGFVIGGN